MTIAILKKSRIRGDDLVVIPRQEYELLKASQIPTLFLKGGAARRLDARVSQALAEYRTGKLKPVSTLRELL